MKECIPRHELKHTITKADYYALRSRLRAIAKIDQYVRMDGTYKIRSLYFDNVEDKVLREKINGVDKREKFRIRYYNSDFSVIHLEKKCKSSGVCLKYSSSVTKEQCERLLEGEIGWMKESKKELLVELYSKMCYQQLRPKVLVDYIREPYIYEPGNVRITFDSDIRTGIYCNQLFHPQCPMITADFDCPIILEVKYDNFIPDVITDILQVGDTRCMAFSKYAACRMYG